MRYTACIANKQHQKETSCLVPSVFPSAGTMRRLQAARECNATSTYNMQRSRQHQRSRHEADSSGPCILTRRHPPSSRADPITPCIQPQHQEQQQHSWVPGRRALLAAVGATGLAWLPSPAKAQPASTDSIIGCGGQQQQQRPGPNSSNPGWRVAGRRARAHQQTLVQHPSKTTAIAVRGLMTMTAAAAVAAVAAAVEQR